MAETKKIISDYIQAGFPFLVVNSYEPERLEEQIVDEISALVTQMKDNIGMDDYSMDVHSWNCTKGVRNLSTGSAPTNPYIDPIALFDWFAGEDLGPRHILLIHNFHRMIGEDMSIIQSIINILPILKTSLRTIVFISPDMDLPIELERRATVIDHALPTSDEIKSEYTKMLKSYKMKMTDEEINSSVEVAKGLTMYEAEDAIALSIIRKHGVDPDIIYEIKSNMIRKNWDLEISSFNETLDDLKGLNNLKEFGREVLPHPMSKGILLLGVPGTGKSHFAKGLGKEIGLPTVSMSFGNMFDSLIGSSEGKIKRALNILDAMSPLLLFVDELEKDLAGARSSGETDSGVTLRVMKYFLTWMSDHDSRVPLIATANSIEGVPAEFLR